MNEENLAREARNQYLRDWRRNNPERVKAINQRYWEKRGKALRQSKAGATQPKPQEE